MSDNPLSGKVSLDTTNYKAGVAELSRQVRVIESGFKAAAAGMEDWDHSANGLELRMKALTAQIGLQQQKVSGLAGVYQELAAGGKTSSKELEDLQIRINKETESLNKMQGELKQTGTALGGLGQAAEKSATEILSDTRKADAAFDELSGHIDKTLQASGKSTTSFAANAAQAISGIKDAFSMVQQALGYLQQAYAQTIGVTLEYADTVKQLSLVSGAGAEETSRMIQMTDDLEISTGTLETAMRGAAVKGIVLTTDSLAKMSDEYLRLAPGTERNTYLLDNFGRSGLEMANLLDKGSKAIRDLSAAQEANLIITERQIANTTAYKRFLDAQGDSVKGLQYEIGMKLIPDMTMLLTTEEKQKLALQEGTAAMKGATFYTGNLAYGLQLLSDHNSIASYLTRQYNGDIITMSHNMELARDAAKDYGAGIDKVAQAASMADAAMKPLTAELILQKSGLDASQPEYWALADALGLIHEDTLGAMQGIAELQQQLHDNKITTSEYAAAVWDLVHGIDALHNKDVTVTVHTIGGIPLVGGAAGGNGADATVTHPATQTIGGVPVIGTGTTTPIPDPRQSTPKHKNAGAQAEGGDYMVTQPTWFLAGEAGLERATFTPAGAPEPFMSTLNFRALAEMVGQTTAGLARPAPGAGSPAAAGAPGNRVEISGPINIYNDMDMESFKAKLMEALR